MPTVLEPTNVIQSAAGNITVRVATRDDAAYRAFATDTPAATVYHLPEWLDAVEDGFAMPCYRLTAERDGKVVGILPLGHSKSVLFGNFLVSVPFGNFGGITAVDPEAMQPLLDAGATLATQLGCTSIELRHIDALPLDLPEHTRKVRQILPFAPDAETMLKGFRKEVRKHIKKSEKSELTCHFSDREGLAEFYDVFARNMRDLGTPVYPRKFFEKLWDHMGHRLKVVTVRLPNGDAIASLVLLAYRKGIESPWASSLREHNALCPNNMMFWEAFQWGIRNGYEYYDFGTSDWDGGVYQFKKQWGSNEQSLHRQFWLAPGVEMPYLNPSNPKYAWKIRAWQTLPMSVANMVGPVLAGKLP